MDLWQTMEVAKRVLDGHEIGGTDAFDTLFGVIYDKKLPISAARNAKCAVRFSANTARSATLL